MASHDRTTFQPTAPVRISTIDSQNSTDSQISPTTSPASPASPTSPTSRAFFGAITARLRERSRSRSRVDTSRKRAESPTVMPPEQLPAARPRQTRQPTTTQALDKSTRPGLQQDSRRSTSSSSSSDPWRGRHSNDWIFNGFSVRDTAKGYLERRKS